MGLIIVDDTGFGGGGERVGVECSRDAFPIVWFIVPVPDVLGEWVDVGRFRVRVGEERQNPSSIRATE